MTVFCIGTGLSFSEMYYKIDKKYLFQFQKLCILVFSTGYAHIFCAGCSKSTYIICEHSYLFSLAISQKMVYDNISRI